MNTVFLGNDAWSVPSLEALHASRHEVGLVVTREPRPAGRGGKLTPTPVSAAAPHLGLPLAEVATVKQDSGFEALRAAAPEVLVVVAYGEILPRAVLDVPSVSAVNVHFSLLPALRGANPVRKAILDGLDATGVTTIEMDEGMDTGPILLQKEEPIRPDDDAGTLGERLATLGGSVLVETLDGIESGELQSRAQDDDAATLAPRLTTEDEWIEWARDATAVDRLVRALSPDPGARTTFRGKVLKVFVATREKAVSREGSAGTILEVRDEGPLVACGKGGVVLTDVLPEGRKRMSGADFVRGYRPEPGDRLARTAG
ncbi:MAG: methionyl-tRNA formyltransferase [Actinomycetota bacterium]